MLGPRTHHPAKVVPDGNHIGLAVQNLVEESNNRRVGEKEALEVDSCRILEACSRSSARSFQAVGRVHDSLSVLLRPWAVVWLLLPTVLRRWLAVSALILLTGIVTHVVQQARSTRAVVCLREAVVCTEARRRQEEQADDLAGLLVSKGLAGSGDLSTG